MPMHLNGWLQLLAEPKQEEEEKKPNKQTLSTSNFE